jgi:hypothetical protein
MHRRPPRRAQMEGSGRVLTRSRLLDAFEVAALLTGYLAFTWLLLPAFRSPVALAAIVLTAIAGAAWITFLSPLFVHCDDAASRGLGPRRTLWIRTDNLARAIPRFALLAAASSALLVALASFQASERLATLNPSRFVFELARYLPLALVQDLALVFVLVRLDGLFPAGGMLRPRVASTVAAAALFALVHAPNPAMMILSGLFVLGAAAAFRPHPNLAALVLCHAWSGAVLRSVTGIRTRVGPFAAEPDVWVTRGLLDAILASLGVRS